MGKRALGQTVGLLYIISEFSHAVTYSDTLQSDTFHPPSPSLTDNMSESLRFLGSLQGHKGWVTAIATSSENPDMILTASRGIASS